MLYYLKLKMMKMKKNSNPKAFKTLPEIISYWKGFKGNNFNTELYMKLSIAKAKFINHEKN